MEIILDLSYINSIFGGNIYFYLRQFFILVISLLFVWYLIHLSIFHWSKHAKKIYLSQQKYVFLSINVPRDNEQGPEAIEKFFSQLAGIKVSPKWWDKNFKGKTQLSISLEMISQEGQISFIIYTPTQYRDLVESSLYSVYPRAEISEIEGYTKKAPDDFPDPDYDLWGGDLGLTNKNPYPIKTYSNFEHGLSKELKDPMSGLIEILGELRPEEEVWIQFIIKPANGSELKKQGEKLVKELTEGKTSKKKKGFFSSIFMFPIRVIGEIIDIIARGLTIDTNFGFGGEEKKVEEKNKNILPGQKKVVEAIEDKVSKIAFETRIRLIYLAPKNVFSKDRGITGVLSSFNTVNTLNMNGIKVEKKVFSSTKRPHKVDASKESILEAYQKRSFHWKIKPKGMKRIIKKTAQFLAIEPKSKVKKTILNTEELATLYHFPVLVTNKSPLVRKTGSKKGEPPFSLPVK